MVPQERMPNSVPSTIISATPTTGAEHRALVRRDSTVLARLRRTETAPDVLRESWRRALGGGLAGAMAMVVQVTTLMWVRTTVMFQYRYSSCDWNQMLGVTRLREVMQVRP